LGLDDRGNLFLPDCDFLKRLGLLALRRADLL
jgi:hypothetical protein